MSKNTLYKLYINIFIIETIIINEKCENPSIISNTCNVMPVTFWEICINYSVWAIYTCYKLLCKAIYQYIYNGDHNN